MTDTMPGDDNVSGSVGDQTTAKNAGVVSTQTDGINRDKRDDAQLSGDQGVTSLLSDPHRTKGDLVMLRRAVRSKWPVKPEHQKVLVDRMLDLVAEPDPKVAVSALRAGVAMVDANIRVDMEEDKADRLDAGKATERVETPIKFIRGTDGEGV